ncbi:MAG: tRNA (adenosine(37)-N6)-dimethylallyltransferase MiaA [Magnetococcales bacterium]|nr:tRNA (adenosine(37)-N6)-dimethylallyltransferase MiaA [Magnetococcales bacterium]
MKNLLAVVGPTASGKTRLGVVLAQALAGEIISADSRQVYRGMDIGTGKDLTEYGRIPHHLIDIVEPGAEFNLFDYQRLAYTAIEDVQARQLLPVLVGGSGLYLDAVLKGYRLVRVPENRDFHERLSQLSLPDLQKRLKDARPVLHNVTDLLDKPRLIRAIEIAEGEKPLLAELPPAPALKPLILGIRWDRSVLRQRITQRLQQRLDAGMVDEVKRLLARGVGHDRLSFYGLEYRFISSFLKGDLDQTTFFESLNRAIHQYAKRQDTWFRRMEKRGSQIIWIDGGAEMESKALAVVKGQYFTHLK